MKIQTKNISAIELTICTFVSFLSFNYYVFRYMYAYFKHTCVQLNLRSCPLSMSSSKLSTLGSEVFRAIARNSWKTVGMHHFDVALIPVVASMFPHPVKNHASHRGRLVRAAVFRGHVSIIYTYCLPN